MRLLTELSVCLSTVNFTFTWNVFLCRLKSDFDETWYEWCENTGLRSYGADFEYLH